MCDYVPPSWICQVSSADLDILNRNRHPKYKMNWLKFWFSAVSLSLIFQVESNRHSTVHPVMFLSELNSITQCKNAREAFKLSFKLSNEKSNKRSNCQLNIMPNALNAQSKHTLRVAYQMKESNAINWILHFEIYAYSGSRRAEWWTGCYYNYLKFQSFILFASQLQRFI